MLERRLKLEKRSEDAKVALDTYERWLAAALSSRTAEEGQKVVADLQERLLRCGDKAGARAVERRAG